VVPTANAEAEHFFLKVEQALDIIRVADPRRWGRILKQLRRIVLVEAGGELYQSDLKAYLVDLPTLRHRSRLQVASAIVHEATHARLDSYGVSYSSPRRARIEAICVAEQIAFLERIPDTQRLVEQTRAALNTAWWSDEAMHQRRLRQLRAYGIPQALVSIIARFGRHR
jgi:hypothetical protein